MASHRFATVLLVVALVPFVAARAEDHPNQAPGFNPDHVFQLGELDHVNLWNGNLVVTLPIGSSFPVGGKLSYGLTLTYNAQLWRPFEYTDSGEEFYLMEPDDRFNAGLGWVLSLGKLVLVGSPQPGVISQWEHESPDGARHAFFRTLHPTTDGPGTDWIFYTRDGTYLRLNERANPTTGAVELEFPDGTVHRFAPGGMLTQLRDRFGNTVDVTYPNGNWRLTDSQGRVQTIYFKNATQPARVVDRVELTGFGGQTVQYQFQYEDALIQRASGSVVRNPGDPNELPLHEMVTLLTGILLPDGSQFGMQYDSGNPGSFDDFSGTMVH